nr:unnamed protein product [Callosobruchus analis]
MCIPNKAKLGYPPSEEDDQNKKQYADFEINTRKLQCTTTIKVCNNLAVTYLVTQTQEQKARSVAEDMRSY